MFQKQMQAQSITAEREKTILVVEDDAEIGAFLVLALQQETSYAVRLVTDSLHALNAIRGFRPHLLLLDYQLPDMNGIDLYDKLHALPGFEAIPCIIISARLPLQEIKKRVLVGLSKPFDLLELFATIGKLLA